MSRLAPSRSQSHQTRVMTQKVELPCPKCGRINPKGAWACGSCTERLQHSQSTEDDSSTKAAAYPSQSRRVTFRRVLIFIICIVLMAIALPFGVSTLMAWISGDLYFGKDPDGADKVLGTGLFLALPIGTVAAICLIRMVLAHRTGLKSR